MTAQPAESTQTLPPTTFLRPAVLLSGTVDWAMYENFRQQLDSAPEKGICVIELSTLGGDPEVARMMGEDIRFNSEHVPARRLVFLGKAMVYSAGVTLMSFFARENRYLTRGTRLMVHERKLDEKLIVNGPLSTCIAPLQAKLNEIETSIRIQNEGFEALVSGSTVTLDEVIARASANWYLEASEAAELGLVEAVL